MKAGGGMFWVWVLLFVALVVITAGAYQASMRDDSEITSILRDVKELKGVTTSLAGRVDENDSNIKILDKNLADYTLVSTQAIEEIRTKQKVFSTDHGILQQRYHALDKKLLAKEQSITHRFEKPVPVEILSPPPVPKLKGKGRGALIRDDKQQ